MKLRTKVLILYFFIMLLVLVCVGVLLPSSLHEQNLVRIQTDTTNQLKHIDFALSNYIAELGNDVRQLSEDDDVRNPDDTGFTSFINATPETFHYSIGEREQVIIDELNSFRLNHPSVSSAYIGREDGVFVRSHKRPSPTAYDPRTRPWYILAKEHPGQVVRTDPYQSVTSPDLNIGIEKSMVLPNGTVYGVLGADITLVDLTKYVTEYGFGRDVQIAMVNETGTVLAAKDPSLLFNNIYQVTGNQTSTLLNSSEGMLTLQNAYLIYYTSPYLGWKYAVIIPFYQIEKELSDSIVTILLFVFIALILLSIITLLVLNHTVIEPILSLTSVATDISKTGQLNHAVQTELEGEIGELSRSFNSMITTIKLKDEANLKANSELSQYRDHLSEIVKERTSQLETANQLLQDQRDELEMINSELQMAKQHAEDMDRLKSAFLATMSHELRTPLNSIIGFTGIILQGLAGPLTTEQHKQLELVKHSARHLLALINDVLDISKIEAGELKISEESVDIIPSILSVITTIQPLVAQKDLNIETDIRETEAVVIGDQRRIEQIILNLMSNAVKFTESGFVKISLWIDHETVNVAIHDSGIGIEQADIDTLFQPFHQIDTGTTRKHEGTGLGLSICKKLIELHRGTITVSSVPGKGSTFTITIPEKKRDNGADQE